MKLADITIELIKEAAKKKEAKPHCIKGNPHHDEEGKFSTQSAAKSWSKHQGDKDPSADQCTAGQFRLRGKRKLIVKTSPDSRCGRKYRDTPNNKAEWMCSGEPSQYRNYHTMYISKKPDGSFSWAAKKKELEESFEDMFVDAILEEIKGENK